MLSRFHLIPERNGQTDRQTDGQTNDRQICYINIARQYADRASVCWRAIKIMRFLWNSVHSSRFWTGWTSRDQKWKSCIGQTPSSTERISCFFVVSAWVLTTDSCQWAVQPYFYDFIWRRTWVVRRLWLNCRLWKSCQHEDANAIVLSHSQHKTHPVYISSCAKLRLASVRCPYRRRITMLMCSPNFALCPSADCAVE